MSLVNKVDRFIKDSDIAHEIIHGRRGREVETDGGPVKTLATAIGDVSEVREMIDALQAGQHGSAIYAPTIDVLRSRPGSFLGQGGFVTTGPGTGQYSWNDAWELIGPYNLAEKAEKSALEAIAAGDLDAALINSHESDSPGVVFTDERNNILAFLSESKISHPQINSLQEMAELAAPAASAIRNVDTDNAAFVVTDEQGNLLISVDEEKINHPDMNSLRTGMGRERSRVKSMVSSNHSDARALAAVIHILLYGQSLSLGFNAKPAVSLAPFNEALMFSGGVRPYDNSGDPSVIYAGLVPLRESTSGPMAAGEGYISGNTLTITLKTAGTSSFDVGQYLGMAGAKAGTKITSLGSGSGSTGTYIVSHSQSVGSAGAPRQVLGGPGAITGGGGGQTMASTAARMYAQLLLDEDSVDLGSLAQRLLFSASGHVGTSLSGLEKGTAPFLRLTSDLIQGRARSDGSGKSYAVGAVMLLEGESDYAEGTAAEEFANKLRIFRADVQEEARKATGVTKPLPLITYQTATHLKYGRAHPEIALAQLQMGLTEDYVALAAPAYMLDYHSDGVHLSSRGQMILGAYFGLALKRWIMDGIKPMPIHATSAYRVGRDIVVEFSVPSGTALVLDSKLGSSNFGFSLATASGADIAVQGVELVGPSAILIRTGGEADARSVSEWRYAWSGSSSMGIGGLRDSQGEWLVFEPNGMCVPMHNWMPISKGVL